MTRKLWFAFAMILGALGLSLATLTWWNRHSTEASLERKVAEALRQEVTFSFADVDEGRFEVRDFEVIRGTEEVHFSGRLVVERRRFAEGFWQVPGSLVYFQPSGSVEVPFLGVASMTFQEVAALRLLGPRRPVWGRPRVSMLGGSGVNESVRCWNEASERGANALFDAHLESQPDPGYQSPNGRQRLCQIIAARVLVKEGRYAEAFTYFDENLYQSLGDEWGDRRLKAALELREALATEPGHANLRLKLEALLKERGAF